MNNPAMRVRHWKMLVRTLNAQHTVTPDKFQELSLQELIDLGILCKLEARDRSSGYLVAG